MSLDYPDYDEPEELARMRAKMSPNDRIRAFVEIFGRKPSSDDELDAFIEEYTLELYNNQMDADPDFDPNL
jgi:hypothetical protein